MSDSHRSEWTNRRGGEAVYALGLIGALVYYIGAAHGFWPVVLAALKALIWPTFIVLDLLRFLHG